MNNVTNELILEHLKRIQTAISTLQEGQNDLKARISELSERTASQWLAEARQDIRVDRLEARLQRIEARLELNS